MKVLIRELEEGHSRRTFAEPAEELDLGGWLRPEGPVQADLDFEKRGDQVVVRGRVSVDAGFECGRCTRPFAAPVSADVLIYADAHGRDEPGDEAALEEEGSILYHDGIALDLTDSVREALILEVPAVPLCRPDCRGLCPRCGQDFNEGPCACPKDRADARWKALEDLNDRKQ